MCLDSGLLCYRLYQLVPQHGSSCTAGLANGEYLHLFSLGASFIRVAKPNLDMLTVSMMTLSVVFTSGVISSSTFGEGLVPTVPWSCRYGNCGLQYFS